MGKNVCSGDSYLYLLNSTYHTTKYGLLKPQGDYAKSNPIHLYIQMEPNSSRRYEVFSIKSRDSFS